jgi:hypothetical protein
VLLLLALGSAHDWIRGCDDPGIRPPEERGVDAPSPPPTAVRAEPAGPATVDLNRADSIALDALPGIGPVLASRILAHRRLNGPFRAPEELMGVRGVGPALYGKLEGRISVGAWAGGGRDTAGADPRR